MKQLRGYLIDPETKTITEVTHNGDYKEIYRFIGADCFDCVRIDYRNGVFIDDEGLLNGQRYFFKLRGYPQPLAGKGLILGNDEEGETVSSSLTMDEVKFLVTEFTELSVQGFVTEEKDDVEIMPGVRGFSIRSTPVFGPPEEKEE